MTCRVWWMIETDDKRGLGRSVRAARHDDDNEGILVSLWTLQPTFVYHFTSLTLSFILYSLFFSISICIPFCSLSLFYRFSFDYVLYFINISLFSFSSVSFICSYILSLFHFLSFFRWSYPFLPSFSSSFFMITISFLLFLHIFRGISLVIFLAFFFSFYFLLLPP